MEAHGSFAQQSCIECKSPYPDDLMQKAIREKSVPKCLRKECGGLVKPEIVFFGEQLPAEFFQNRMLPAQADLCIVMGTSLTVQPFASLPSFCRESVPRVLINQEHVGNLGSRPDDVLMLEDCDAGVRRLANACGWLEELERLWAELPPAKQPSPQPPKAEEEKKTRDEKLQDEVDKLTKEVEESLRLSEEQHKWLENHVDNKFARAQDEDKEVTAPVPETPERVQKAESDAAATDGGGGLRHVFPWLNKKPSL